MPTMRLVFLCRLALLFLLLVRHPKCKGQFVDPKVEKNKDKHISNLLKINRWKDNALLYLRRQQTDFDLWISSLDSLLAHFQQLHAQMDLDQRQLLEALTLLDSNFEDVEEKFPEDQDSATQPPIEVTVRWTPHWWAKVDDDPLSPDELGLGIEAKMSSAPTGFFTEGQSIVFDEVLMDTKNTYDETLGVFEAPHHGMYLFYVQCQVEQNIGVFELIYHSQRYGDTVLTEVLPDSEAHLTYAITWMNRLETVALYPFERMTNGQRNNLAPGWNTKISVYALLTRLPAS